MKNVRNQVQLIGRLGQDVEHSTVSNGNSKARFSIATNEYYKDKRRPT